MSVDRALLARYLRQLRELGIADLYLDDLTPADALALASGRAAPGAPSASPTKAPASATAPARPAATTTAEPGAAVSRATRPQEAAVSAPHAAPRAPASATQPGGVASTALPHAPASAALPGGAVSTGALQVLATTAASCTRCSLHETRSTVVFGEGSATAQLVVVGEAPGQEEDRTGRPFVGRAGKLLDLLLMSVGFPRAEVYICNVLKCRPPNNRNPLPDEVSACTTTLLHGQLEAIAPRVLLAVGKFAAQALLESDASIGQLRGAVHTYRGTPLVVTYHPAFLLRSPQMTRVAWQDFQLVRRIIDEQA